MGKRKANGSGKKSKRFKASGFIDPNTSGIYATCNRGKEKSCTNELMNLFSEKVKECYDLTNEDQNASESEEELSIEDKIQKELADMRDSNLNKQEIFKPITLNCECLIFIKTRKPVEPAAFVEKICRESLLSGEKKTRYTQRLSPVTYSVSPSLDELRKLCEKVLKPHFHKDENQEPYKFAIQVSKRNFNSIEKGDIIRLIAECVGRKHGHSVDLKNFDKLILVECYKSNIGMSVINDYNKLEKYNLQQIFDKTVDQVKSD